jgi:hypothetical protein
MRLKFTNISEEHTVSIFRVKEQVIFRFHYHRDTKPAKKNVTGIREQSGTFILETVATASYWCSLTGHRRKRALGKIQFYSRIFT